MQHHPFSGTALENPHEHMMTFLEYCNTLKQNGVPPEAIRMQLFPFSLSGNARMWFHALPHHCRDIWQNIMQAFFERYFPPTKAAEYRDRITRFVQFSGERSFVDSAAGGGIMNKTLVEATELIERMAIHNFSRSNERAIHPVQQVSEVQSTNICQICGELGHTTHGCGVLLGAGSQIQEVNYAQNQGPYSQNYNPSWRNHSNLSYKTGGQPSSSAPSISSYKQQALAYQPAQQPLFQTGSAIDISEMMKLQKEMFSGMQETMKMQSKLFIKTMQHLTLGVSNLQVSNNDNKLPSQTETNPKQCGAITSTEAIITRSGKNTGPILTAPYVAPHLRQPMCESESVQKPAKGK
nr:uncharacterized protein LOC127316114 [Lolium perenne]